MEIYDWILVVLFTEAITELVVKSDIFLPLRKLLFNRGQTNRLFSFFHALLDCGYCFSVWAAVFSLLLVKYNHYIPIMLFITSIVIHRLSNITHNLIDKVRQT